ncbi:hypothetical protein ACCO45_013310 [Purpureocillium lilacinum]|uniref:Uncharacterized protein n=1 Tax=Purpureocillium lilacinum TaxID=33203 RepID=A0ACC4DB39_PURLI
MSFPLMVPTTVILSALYVSLTCRSSSSASPPNRGMCASIRPRAGAPGVASCCWRCLAVFNAFFAVICWDVTSAQGFTVGEINRVFTRPSAGL